ncbi:hypothetical protein BpHYR1_005107 [Brachionus plicatilis]|uniref:Uncharacterized protein n=1 Tax=Brachionus plicatilis TaxID=10195 RepID=A0A3M7R5R9_BRAPC|nr:hypothetical protein BpHYR1_005107 [Brachionus plicatilis]
MGGGGGQTSGSRSGVSYGSFIVLEQLLNFQENSLVEYHGTVVVAHDGTAARFLQMVYHLLDTSKRQSKLIDSSRLKKKLSRLDSGQNMPNTTKNKIFYLINGLNFAINPPKKKKKEKMHLNDSLKNFSLKRILNKYKKNCLSNFKILFNFHLKYFYLKRVFNFSVLRNSFKISFKRIYKKKFNSI